MLSLKFKRMCSRVIASLSAMGVISIADSSDASAAGLDTSKVYKIGDTFTYDRKAATTFNAQYNTATTTCVTGSAADGIQSYTAVTGGCEYTCKNGMFFEISGQYKSSFVVTGTSSTISNGSGVCRYTKPSCSSVTNATSSVVGSDTAGWFCRWTCNDGYFVQGGAQTITSFTGATPALTPGQTITGTKACVGKIYTVTFNCKSQGKIEGTSEQFASVTGRYGSAFTFSKRCTPNAGYSFVGWKAGS